MRVVRYNVDVNRGGSETKEAVLSENDKTYAELRHLHLADASLRLNRRMEKLKESKLSKAKLSGQKLKDSNAGLKEMSDIIKSLPQEREV